MILRIAAVPFLVCWWCAAQAAPDSGELEHRLRAVEAERSHGRLETAESMLADVQAQIERMPGSGFLLAVALRVARAVARRCGPVGRGDRLSTNRGVGAAAGAARHHVLWRWAWCFPNLHASAYADRGDSGLALSLSTEGMAMLQASVEQTDPDFAVALYAQGVALHSLGRNSEALRDQRKGAGHLAAFGGAGLRATGARQ